MTGWLDIRIICPSRATCLPATDEDEYNMTWWLLFKTTSDFKMDYLCINFKSRSYFGVSKQTLFRRERAMTGWLDIRIICPSRATCLPAKCCFSELEHMVQVLRTHRGHPSSNPRFQCGSIFALCKKVFIWRIID
jgi:hypothetical protein